MGIEIERLGDPVWRALTALQAADDITPLLDMLDGAPEGWIREALWFNVATPDTLARQLERPEPNLAVVERLVARMKLAAAPALLDATRRSPRGLVTATSASCAWHWARRCRIARRRPRAR